MEVSWKRILSVFFACCVAGISGLAGAAAGGYAIPADDARVIAQQNWEKGCVLGHIWG